MPFERIKRSSRLHEVIANTIQEQIITGELKPGDTLPSETELMQQMGAGRYSVREALRVLETNGMIIVRHGSRKGPIITRPSHTLVSDFLRKAFYVGGVSRSHISQFRASLESSIIEILTLATPDASWLEKIESNIQETKKKFQAGGDIAHLNAQFHVLLAQATENPVFTILMNTLFATPQIQGRVVSFKDRLSTGTIEYHEKIFQAIKAGDGDKAKALINQHITEVDEAWKAQDNLSSGPSQKPGGPCTIAGWDG
jgi:GntR family transcriptional regulator, transcriptional repressor for pyruvate dehydrogenase complex